MEDYYQIFGIDKTATQEEIRKKYLFLVKAYHPDRYQDSNDKKLAEEELKKINEAFNVIGNEESRNKYDSDASNNNSESSSQKSTQQQSTNQNEEEIKAIISYFEYLLRKWNFILKYISLSQIEIKSFAKLTEVIDSLFVNAKSIPQSENKKIFKTTYEIVEYIAQIQIALGLEFESNQKALKFPKDKLLQSSILPLIITLDELLNKMTLVEKESLTISAAIKDFPNTALSSAEYLFTFGQNKYNSVSNQTKKNSSSEAQNNSNKSVNNYCENCGRFNITKKSTYRKNVGMFYKRRYSKISGKFCPPCHEKLFWNAILTNLFLGWWGIISFLINPFLILMNISNYMNSWEIRNNDNSKKLSSVDWKLLIPICIIFSVIAINVLNTISTLSKSEYSNKIANSYQLTTSPPLQTAIPATSAPPTPTLNVNNKVIVTVINKGAIAQDVYCEGIPIFTISPGETKTFRFQKGNWRIDTCYPGKYPCNNFKYLDLNFDTFTYTIR